MENETQTNSTSFGPNQVVFWATIDTCLMILIIAANILTICALRISRKLANLISNHFICSLAFSDLIVGLMLPYHLAFYITSDLGRCKQTCLLRFVMIVLACCASIYNLLAIALDRYIAIVHPLHYNRFMTKKMVFGIITLGWICAFTLATCPIYWNNWELEGPGIPACELYQVLPKKYVIYVLTPSFTSIWVTMLLVYWRIWKEAREHMKRMKKTAHSNGPPNNDWKSVQVVLLILGCFSICWLPYFSVIISIKVFNLSANPFYESAFTLAMANSGINPAIYAWKNKGFRKAFLRLLKCQNPNVSEHHFSNDYIRKIKQLNGQVTNQNGISSSSKMSVTKLQVRNEVLKDNADSKNHSSTSLSENVNLNNLQEQCEMTDEELNTENTPDTQM